MITITITPDETENIQQAIDTCYNRGGGKVVLTPGVYVSGTLQLKDHVTIHLEKGTLLLGSNDITDYPENDSCFIDGIGEKRGRALVIAYNAVDIGISGEGVIDGRGRNFSQKHEAYNIRPFLVRFVNCEKVAVKDVCLRMSAAWCLHIQDSRHVEVENITITNRCNENNDGIDIDGCSDVDIHGCMIDSGDDALCMKSTSNQPCQYIRIRNCRVTSNCSAFKIGTESVGDYKDIEVSDCMFYDVNCCAVKVVPVDGGNVDNLYIHDIEMKNCTGPVFFSTGRRLRKYFTGHRQIPGQIRHVVLERIYAHTVSTEGRILDGKPWGNGKGCVVFSGLPELPIEDVMIRDCTFDMPGGIMELPKDEVPEMGTQYPEFHLFDILPSWGMYLRDVKGMQCENMVMTKRGEDVRPMVKQHNVTGE
ncbi:MAG: right-handed parallel beta-helix repeat-containing protein [Lachnospiraceae bacterium]|nr:right-handed parallel beta-helix repeat-containing protein [Lachnospiraceae bacterium]